MMSGRQDSNLRPPGPKPGALTELRYAPYMFMFYFSALIKRWWGDSNPRYRFQYDSLANCWFKPLTHPTSENITRTILSMNWKL